MSLVHRRSTGPPRVGVPLPPSHRDAADSATSRSGPHLHEREKYNTFIRANYDSMQGYARWLCRDWHLAQDLVQDAALNMWRACKSGQRKVDELSTAYACRAVRNAFLDSLRKLRREKRFLAQVGDSPAPLFDGDLDESMTGHEVFLRLREVLSQRHWEIYVLTEAYKFKAKEIAERLDLATGTVSNYLSVARKLVAEESRKLVTEELSPF